MKRKRKRRGKEGGEMEKRLDGVRGKKMRGRTMER